MGSIDTTSEERTRKCIFVFDSIRNRSHLFFRYCSTNPQLYPLYHPFIHAAYIGEERWVRGARVSERRRKAIFEDMVPMLTTETIASRTKCFEDDLADADAKECLVARFRVFPG
jgi:hypothetical protein